MSIICDEPDPRDSLSIAQKILEFIKNLLTNLNEETILSKDGISGLWYLLDYVATVCDSAADRLQFSQA